MMGEQYSIYSTQYTVSSMQYSEGGRQKRKATEERPCMPLFIRSRILTPVFYILTSVLLFSAGVSFAETNIRVLLIDNKVFKMPQKDEKLEKLGMAKGDVLLSGLKYSGNIEVWKGEAGLYIVNEIPLEEYVKGVVAGEVGNSWPSEMLKAQAVVSRTYALYQMLNNALQKARYHLTSSVLHQVYKGEGISEGIIKAVDETKGEILTYEGTPIVAFYHSTTDGLTEDPVEVFGKSYPYLKPVEASCELSPYCAWEKRIPCTEIEGALNLKGIKEIRIDSYTVTQRAKNLRIVADTEEREVSAKDLRKQLGWDKLPSTMITKIGQEGEFYIFEGKGYGHGVGMCQWTALQMAKAGIGYREILSKFYPGASLESYEGR